MANSEAGTSSDVARALGGEYQVFLNFRGPDTRHGFTDFLYHGLVDAGIRVFRDEDELRFGKVIGGSLLRAINNSIIYIPIFSRNYASSKWCLHELAHIIDNVSKSEGKKSVFPIFFDVEPEDVKLKTPRYSDALLEHENKFPDEIKVWRKALAEVDEIKGWNVKKDQSQAKLVESVVQKVLEKLETRQKLLPQNLVGLDDRIRHLTELLDVNHRDVRLIAIYGMGGIGKTTVAKVVFNRLSSHFGKCCSFLDDVRENSATKEGIVKLQNKLLSDIVGSESAGVEDSEHGMRRIGDTFRIKKVLVVLDDIDKKEHIEKLIGNSSLHSGSRIIITMRNIAILQVEGFKGELLCYEMLKMDDDYALQLFCRHAFGRGFPSNDYQGLSSEIVSSTGGLPLAIEVIGSLLMSQLLKGKNSEIWEEMMEKLRKGHEKKILEKLRISYDDLDKYHKQIFLDIACFFSNKNKTNAIYMWTDCQFYPKEGIEVLTERCLVKVLDDDKFWMHDQLIALGRQIVREESQDDLGKQSRLWIAKEALQIIRTEERLDKVQALKLNGQDGFINITNEDVERLPNLRVDNMFLDHLVVFKLHMNNFSDDSKAWDLIKGRRRGCSGWLAEEPAAVGGSEDDERRLRVVAEGWMAAGYSRTAVAAVNVGNTSSGGRKQGSSKLWLLGLPDAAVATMVAWDGGGWKMRRSEELPSSNWSWRNLSTLVIGWCEVEDIPLEGFTRLEKLTVSRCQQLQRLSIPWELRKLREVYVYGCPELVEIQIVGLSKLLECLSVHECESLARICGLSYLKNLEKLRIHGCGVLTNFEGLDELESLKSLAVTSCKELTWLIDASCTNIPDDCVVRINKCGDAIKDCESLYDIGMSLKRYREEILSNISNKTGLSFAIRFHLGVKRSSDGFEFVGGIKRENEDVAPGSVTHKGLIADVKCFGFRLKRMWYTAPGTYHKLLIEVKSDEQVKGMVLLASKRGSIHLYVEGGVDSEWEGEYDDEMMEMLREEWAMRTDVYSDEDGPEWDVPNPDEDADSASVGESEADGTSSIDDFRSEPGNAECVEATGNRRQSRGGRIGYPGRVDEGKAVSMENRKEEKDDSGEPANQNEFVRSSCQRCEGVEHQDSSCKATTEFEDEGALSSLMVEEKTESTVENTYKNGKRKRDRTCFQPRKESKEGL
ncbi:probable disease resistance protein RPP1 [Rhodamnia argentea]|uniref:Probable disease resistance protein RPP1 n=1 Tax=Rhodamnia argentea TaxID=178133 RepID=A0ABM3HBJ4_9MYRT|nr:probable disease resistance protein RPP1 [Rhodamnia argentea]